MAATTIDDVARHAGVSAKTVSRVVNREPNVRPETAEKVKASIDALQYRPNPSARGLAGNRSYMVGLLYGEASPSYLMKIQEGVLETCTNEEYGVVLLPCDFSDPDLADTVADFLRRTRVDGLIMTPPVTDHPGVVARLRALGTPYVRITPKDREEGRSIEGDDLRVVSEMTRYLIGLGHRRIGFVKGHPDHGAMQLRLDGFMGAMAGAGITVKPEFIVDGLFTFDSGAAAARVLLGVAQPPTAIIASNDDMAAGVLHVAHEQGLRIPHDLSVVGFDDTPLSRQVWPSLTTIRQPIVDMGRRAGRLLLEQIGRVAVDGATGGGRTLDYELVIRDTSGSASE